MMDVEALMRLATNEAMKIRAQVVEHRNCFCGLPAWFRRIHADGSKEFQCSNGHLNVSPPTIEIK